MADIYSRRTFIGLGLSCLGLQGQVRAKPKIMRLGFLIGEAPTLIEAFESELRLLKLLGSDNFELVKRVSRTNTADLRTQSAELAAMGLDLVVAGALPQALELRKNNPNLPMVIGTCPGMVSNGFAKTLKKPGGIYTGMEELPSGLTERRLEFLKLAAPKIKKVAMLSTTPGVGGHELQVADAEKAAPKLGISVRAYRAANLDELQRSLEAISKDKVDGMINFQGGLSLAHRQRITDFAAANRIPAIYQSAFFPDAGGLMSWAPDQELQFRIAARYAAKILAGARPGDLAIHTPERYYLTLNLKAARALNLDLPRKLLRRAHRVIE